MSHTIATRDHDYTQTKLYQHYLNCLRESDCQKKSAELFMNSLPEEARTLVQAEASRVTLQRRRYARGQFYCWALHPDYDAALTDPWPASMFPKALIHACLALDMAVKHPLFSSQFANFNPGN